MTKEAKKKKFKLKEMSKQDIALIAVFILLVILVIILASVALNLKNKSSSEKANIVIPILEENSQSEISVDISEMKLGETKEYVFKVANYKDKDVNNKELEYDIDITPSANTSLELYKNGSDTNLLVNEDDTVINDNQLPKKKKTEDEYHLIIKITDNPDEIDKITLRINS